MTENEFKKEVLDEAKPVDETQVIMEEEAAAMPQGEETAAAMPQGEQPQVTMNLMDFGGIITNMYCGISDTIYKRIKHTDNAPKWEAETKQAVNDALTAYLSTVNVAVKPIYALIGTIATIEVMRYMKPVELPVNE